MKKNSNHKYKFEHDINKFKGYDRDLAICHMHNFGVIVCSKEWGDPIEVEDVCYLLEDGEIVL